MRPCFQLHCSCRNFTPFHGGSPLCSTCVHRDSVHIETPSDGEDTSEVEETHSLYKKGTRSYIEHLQNEASAAAVTEAVSETRRGFRPQRTGLKVVSSRYNKLTGL